MPSGPKFLTFLSLPPRANMPLRGSTTAVFLPVWAKKCQNRPKMGVRTQIFGTRTELFARAHGAWRLAAALRRLRKFHTKYVPSHLIVRTKNSGSEESLAVDGGREGSFSLLFPPLPPCGVSAAAAASASTGGGTTAARNAAAAASVCTGGIAAIARSAPCGLMNPRAWRTSSATLVACVKYTSVCVSPGERNSHGRRPARGRPGVGPH
eukprot:scaffold80677_cov64-Phaeocystis_antarctica.AAC.1